MPGPTRIESNDQNPRPTRMDGADQGPRATRIDADDQGPRRTRMDGAPTPGRTRLEGADGAPSAAASSDAPLTWMPSDLEGRLVPQRDLGSGAEGMVYHCVDVAGLISKGGDFAVKVYRREVQPEFAIEFGTVEFDRQFPRPHAVQIYRRAQDPDGRHYDVMEYCPAGTLEDFLKAHTGHRVTGDAQAREVLVELADALTAIQRPGTSMQMVHGDIKPENVLVRTGGSPLDLVLTDFGLSVQMHNRSKISSFGKGTLSYSAPGALHRTSLAADWWSIGMIMFRAIVGRDYFTYPDGRFMDDNTISEALATRPISLDRLDDVSWLDGTDPQTGRTLRERWSLLLKGYFTRDPDKRWSYPETSEWLRGGSPAVADEPIIIERTSDGGVPREKTRATHPFAFSGSGELYTPAEVAAAAARDATAFAQKMSGQGAAQFMRWMQTEFGETDWPFSAYQTDWSPQFRALYFRSQLDPEQPLSHQGYQLNGRTDLVRLGQAAAEDPKAQALISELHDSGLIGALDSSSNRPGFVVTNEDWHGTVTRALSHIRESGQMHRLIQAERDTGSSNDPERTVIARRVLGPALAAAAGAEKTVRESLTKYIASRPEANKVGWFQRLGAQ